MKNSGDTPRVVYDNQQLHFEATAFGFVPWHQLHGVKNTSISKAAKYRSQAGDGLEFYREDLEEISQRFNIKYLLAIMNSNFAKQFINKRRRDEVSIYPDDWKQLPIAPIPMEQQQPFVKLVDTILAEFEKHGYPLPPDAARRVAESEREIDARAAALYGL